MNVGIVRGDKYESYLISSNTKFLLWREGEPKINWSRWLRGRLGWSEEKAQLFLHGNLADSKITKEDLSIISIQLGHPEEGTEIRFEDFVAAQPDLLEMNLRYLVDGLEHGKKKHLAKALGVSPTTVSRWLSGVFQPRESALKQMVNYFGLSPKLDLKKDPVFLSVDPVTQVEKKNWLFTRTKSMSEEQLNELFPALRKILD